MDSQRACFKKCETESYDSECLERCRSLNMSTDVPFSCTADGYYIFDTLDVHQFTTRAEYIK
jgi:hypothetical protein